MTNVIKVDFRKPKFISGAIVGDIFKSSLPPVLYPDFTPSVPIEVFEKHELTNKEKHQLAIFLINDELAKLEDLETLIKITNYINDLKTGKIKV